MGPCVTPGKVYGLLNFKKFAFNKIGFLKIYKIHEIIFLIRGIFCFAFVLQCKQKEHVHN